ncbi:peptidoglycan glycosyltransferase FtsI [Blochmannia endosymbiont of Camponotus sp.]|uniref:peptidoglycan glycosyltransferase FtsI n=1 Tax=Blochmannia endosymbiont of Camponotus sp. TaxID=700220 RepID=UPI002023D9C9|nr:peptidoglycan glycosyltransferase FtsI [Blochmannia endosymbiont of Camponotus sp.]URJ30224.1 peptidoglycan glycosyltransferase FtsI [Blochmannia endosymbiont of Camponotus sp.]
MKFKPYNFQIILSNKRFNLLYSCIFFILVILLLRLTYLQVIYSNKLINEGNMRSLRVQHISFPRGIITDRLGQLLAISIPADSVWIDPYKINRNGGISSEICRWRALSKILNIPFDKLSSLVSNHATGRFIYLARQIHPSVSQSISQLKLPGVYLQQESKRYYPAGRTTAHLIGITDIDSQGIEGIEKSFNTWLSGQRGTKVIRKDRFGRTIEETTVEDGQSSQNIVLSIDERLQYLAYHELNNAVRINKAESGSIVLIDINTGEILAMTNYPSYNPNNLSITNKSVMRNRAITDAFEPGSTVKPIVIMAALKHNIITTGTVVNTSPYRIDGHQIKDVIYRDKLTVGEILKKSSNVGVSKLALSMPATTLVNTYLNFGMGKATNIGLIGESSGIYPYDKCWSDIERATFSYGYGLMITPLQLAKVYATIGGMGVSKPLSITRVESPLTSGHRVFPRPLVRAVLDMMESVSLSGSNYQETIKGYRIAVKTGTVKTVGSHGKYINKYIACAAGVAPASNPRFALAVVINDPKNGHYYGSMVSAPVFRTVMGNTLKIMNIVPDFLQ